MDNSDVEVKVADAGMSEHRYAAVRNDVDDRSLLQDSSAPLFRKDRSLELENNWQQIQASFVDEPRLAVEKADALVKKAIDDLSASFSDMRASLEMSWEQDKEVSTEDLRQALQSYRSFFKRLLSI